MKNNVIYVDVDDTLIRSSGAKRIPMPLVVEGIRRLKQDGATLYLWGSGGAEYARLAADELGLEDCFVAFLPKPSVYLDDQPITEWRYCSHAYPGEVGSIVIKSS